MNAGACHTDQNIARLQDQLAVIMSFSSTIPTEKPARSYSSSGISPGCSAVSPPIRRTACLLAALRHTGHDRRDLLRIVLAAGNIVQEKQRLAACTCNIVHAHGNTVNTDRVMLVQ